EVELITITIEQENFAYFLAEISEEEEEGTENPFTALFADETATAAIVMTVGLDADGNVVYYELVMEFSLEGADASALSPDLPEGTTLTFTMQAVQTGVRGEFNAEFDP